MSIPQRARACSAAAAVILVGIALVAGTQVRAEAAVSPHRGIAAALVGSYLLADTARSLTAFRVEIEPDGFTVRKGHRGFLLGYVLSGAVRAQADDALAIVYEAGESFVEQPWTAHSVIENASRTEPASLLVIFAAGPDTPLPVFDH